LQAIIAEDSMARVMMILFALVAGAEAGKLGLQTQQGQARQAALEQEWSKELQDPLSPPGTTNLGETKLVDYKSPIQRVVSLLKKMKDELVAEADKEAEMYDKMVCWCETSEKEKTKAVADAEAKESALESELDERQARFGVLSTEIDQTKNDIVEYTEALKTATAIREKGASDFRSEETDLVQAIDNLKNAIFVLGKHQGGSSFLQLDNSMLSSLRVMLRDAALRYEELQAQKSEAEAKHASAKRQSLAALLQMPQQDAATHDLLEALDVHSGSDVPSDEVPLKFAERVISRRAKRSARPAGLGFLQASSAQPNMGVGTTSYSSRSDGIYGILTQMLEEFEAELKTAQKEEVTTVTDFEAMSAAKSAQIEAAKKKLDEMEGEFAANQKAISDAQEDLELTRNQRSEDIKFLQNLQKTCNDLDTEWERRSKTRADETAAVSETLVILTEDDNWEQVQKGTFFLQVSSETSMERVRRNKAVEALQRAAQSPDFDADDLLSAWQNRRGSKSKGRAVGAGAGPRAQLSTLAISAQLDSFTKVKEMMDTMIAELKKEQVEEVKFKSFCVKELDITEQTTYKKNVLKKDLETKIEQLQALMEKLAKEIQEAQEQIADTKTEILKASQGREAENAQFQTTVADCRATQAILKKALLRMEVFYKKVKGGSLAQKGKQTPPVQFNSYKDNTGASPVIGLIKQISEESKALEAESTASEKQAQADYETMVKDSNALIAELDEAILAKSKAIAKAKEDMADTNMDLDSTISELEALAQYDLDLHAQCDFTLKNFDIRQKARLQEMEAIGAAKGILSGDTQLS
jgi:hypothetical protein